MPLTEEGLKAPGLHWMSRFSDAEVKNIEL